MEKLLKRISEAIEEKAQKYGISFPGDETVSIELQLSNEEIKVFYDLDLSENVNYNIDGNMLQINYNESE